MSTNIAIAQRLADLLSPLSEPMMKKLSAILTRKELKKNEYLLQEGQVCRQISFVESGLLRHFYYKNAKEITVQFVEEGHLSVCMESFLRHVTTYQYIEAFEPTVIYEIPYLEIMQLVKEHEEMGRLYQRFLERQLFDAQQKIESFRFESAQERYIRFRRENPTMLKRMPLVHVASYLLMSPETLSRVRSIVEILLMLKMMKIQNNVHFLIYVNAQVNF